MFFLFFNQKTAYEMRISDWSSDVCSSDLRRVNLDQLVLCSFRLELNLEQELTATAQRGLERLPAAVAHAGVIVCLTDLADLNRGVTATLTLLPGNDGVVDGSKRSGVARKVHHKEVMLVGCEDGLQATFDRIEEIGRAACRERVWKSG